MRWPACIFRVPRLDRRGASPAARIRARGSQDELIGWCCVLRTLGACKSLRASSESRGTCAKEGHRCAALSSAFACQGKPLDIRFRLGVNSFDLDDSP